MVGPVLHKVYRMGDITTPKQNLKNIEEMKMKHT